MAFTGFGKFQTQQRAARTGVNPAQPHREGPHPGGARAEVLGRQPAQVRRQAGLSSRALLRGTSGIGAAARASSPIPDGPVTVTHDGDRRRDALFGSARRRRRAQAEPARRRSRPGAGAPAGRAPGRGARGRASCGSAAASSTRSRRTRSRSSRSPRSSRRTAPRACARSSRSARTRARPAARDRRREARRHRLDRARVRGGVRRASRDAPPLADAMTVNPYLGRDSLEPFLDACRREGAGIFCLVKTSNPGSADVQDVALTDGRRAMGARRRARPRARARSSSGERGLSSLGAVVGATFPHEVAPRRASCCRARRSCCRESARKAVAPAELAAAFSGGPAKRARLGVAFGHLCVPHSGRRLAHGGRRRGRAPRARGLECLGRVGRPRQARRARYAAPRAFLLAVTIAVLLIRSGLGGGATPADHDGAAR